MAKKPGSKNKTSSKPPSPYERFLARQGSQDSSEPNGHAGVVDRERNREPIPITASSLRRHADISSGAEDQPIQVAKGASRGNDSQKPECNQIGHDAIPNGAGFAALKALLEKSNDKSLKLEAAKVMHDIMLRFSTTKGVKRFKQLQDALAQNAVLFTKAEIMSYDKLLEKIAELEQYVDEHGGEQDAVMEPAEHLEKWLNGEGEITA